MADLTKRLVLEIELPQMYVEDIPEAIASCGLGPGASMSDEILSCIGEPNFGALTIEVSGEKDSDIVTAPFMVRSARIEDEPPSEPEWLQGSFDDLVARSAESNLERSFQQGYDEGAKDGQGIAATVLRHGRAAMATAKVLDPDAFTGEGYSPSAAAQSRDSALAMGRDVGAALADLIDPETRDA